MAVLNEIIKSFNKQARTYEQAAKVQSEIGTRLLERLHYIKLNPRYILDLGCGSGFFSQELAKLYPKARIIGVDLAQHMLYEARKKQTWRRKWSLCLADMHHLPFQQGMFDLVFANQVIHWSASLELVIRELNRVMSVNGCLMFTTLGPDTFKELTTSWADADDYMHTNFFPDMHDVGDCLQKEYLIDPVVDMERLTLHYETLPHLIKSLKNQGVKNINPQRNPGLTGKNAWRSFAQHYDELKTKEGKYPLTYEVVYGHAWKGTRQKIAQGVEAYIPVNSIKINKRSED